MARRQYTQQERDAALEVLDAHFNNFARASQQTGIPQRTLRDWHRARRIHPPPPPQPPSVVVVEPASASPEAAPSAAQALIPERFPDKDAAVEYIVNQFLAELTHFADELPQIMQMASPYHRLLTAMHIIDRLDKLRSFIPPEQMTVRVVRVDKGIIQNETPWQSLDDEDDQTY